MDFSGYHHYPYRRFGFRPWRYNSWGASYPMFHGDGGVFSFIIGSAIRLTIFLGFVFMFGTAMFCPPTESKTVDEVCTLWVEMPGRANPELSELFTGCRKCKATGAVATVMRSSLETGCEIAVYGRSWVGIMSSILHRLFS